MSFRSHHSNSSSVQALLREDDGVRGDMRRRGMKPRDHHRENIIAMREKQRANRVLKESEYNQPIPRNDKYAHVKSKVKKDMTRERVDLPDDDMDDDIDDYPEGDYGYDEDDMQSQPPASARSQGSTASAVPKKKFLQRGASVARMRERAESKRSEVIKSRASENRDITTADTTATEGSSRGRKLTKPPVPSAKESAPLLVRTEKNFIRENMTEAVTKPLHPAGASKQKGPWVPQGAQEDNPDAHNPKALNKNYGKVPKYVRERVAADAAKREAEEEAARLAAECPDGMMLMPESERLETLAILQKNKKDIEFELGRMPIVIDTHGMRKRKAALEKKIDEIDSALTIFSRSKVFITAE